MRFCCRGVLQFVLVKPLVAIFDIALIASRNENNPVWLTIKMILYNISYAFALYCLFLFYLATKKLIKNFRPISKFATVKGKSLLIDSSLLCLNQVPLIFYFIFIFTVLCGSNYFRDVLPEHDHLHSGPGPTRGLDARVIARVGQCPHLPRDGCLRRMSGPGLPCQWYEYVAISLTFNALVSVVQFHRHTTEFTLY